MSGLPIFGSPEPGFVAGKRRVCNKCLDWKSLGGEWKGSGTYRRFMSWKAFLLCSALYKNTFIYTSVVCLNNRKKGDSGSL